MVLSREIISSLFFGFTILLAYLALVLTTEEARPYRKLDIEAWEKIVFKSIPLTLPVAGSIKLLQDWFPDDNGPQFHISRVAFLAGAYVLTVFTVVTDTLFKQVKAAGIDLPDKYRGRYLRLMFSFLGGLFVIQTVIVLWRWARHEG